MKVNVHVCTVFKVYSTKYALTKGIREVTVRETSSPEIVEQVSDTLFGVYHHKGEWHRSKEDAIAQNAIPDKNHIGLWTWEKPFIVRATGGQEIDRDYASEANVAAAILDAVEECRRLDKRTGKPI